MKKGNEGKAREDFVRANGSLSFRESPEFYKVLDERIRKRHIVNIQFDRDRPGLDSKLWQRLRQCKNWKDIEVELERISRGEDSPLRQGMVALEPASIGLTAALLTAWIATLVAGVILFATYRGCKVRFGYGGDGTGTIEIDPIQ